MRSDRQKPARYTGANPLAGRWTPGTLTNQITLLSSDGVIHRAVAAEIIEVNRRIS